jgi:hypothetical protein
MKKALLLLFAFSLAALSPAQFGPTWGQLKAAFPQLSATNTYTGGQTFNGPIAYAIQSIATNGGTQTIAWGAGVGSNVVFTGSTASSVFKFPATPTAGTTLNILNAASVAVTLDGNGANIDSASTVPMSAGFGRTVVYVSAGVGWRSAHLTKVQADTLYGALAGANTWTTTNTFSGPLVWGIQTFTQSASWTGTVSATSGGTVALVTGTGASGTLTIPAAPTTGWIVSIISAAGISNYTLTAGGTTQIGTATSLTISAGSSALFQFDGTRYQQLAGSIGSVTFSSSVVFNSSATAASSFSAQGVFRVRVQAFSGAGTISNTGCQVEKTAAGAYTLALPTSPIGGDTYWVFDGYGDAGTNNLSLSSSDKAINGTAAGGGAVTAVITNYGRATITYDGTAWKLAKG